LLEKEKFIGKQAFCEGMGIEAAVSGHQAIVGVRWHRGLLV